MKIAQIASEIKARIEGDVSLETQDLERAARDTSLFYVLPACVMYPKTQSDIQEIVTYVASKKKEGLDISVTARAAGTCMTGGPLTTSFVLDMTRYMNHIIAVNTTTATAEPGVYYRNFEKATLSHGWLMPSYPASRELAAIGGIVSNNSGGEKTLTYGKTENYVRSLEVVFADGSTDSLRELTQEELTIKMNEPTTSGRIHKQMFELYMNNEDLISRAKPSVSKNSSGYMVWNIYNKERNTFDLSKLITGSQGTLAIIGSATLSGVTPKTHSRMLVMFIPSTQHLGEVIPRILTHKPETLESYDDHTFKIALRFFKDIAKRMGGNMFTLGFKFIPEFWMALTGGVPKIILMAEFTGDSEEAVEDSVTKAYQDMLQFGFPCKRTHNEQEAKKYWTFRRESFNLLRQKLSGYRTAPTIDDIIVHPKDLPEFLPKLEVIFAKYPDLIYTIAGHMGDANFHIIPLVDIQQKGIIDTLHKLMDEVYELVFSYNGSMSGEHNDGLLRTAYIPKMFSPEIVKLFEATKMIFDPQNILNPGKKVFDDKNHAWSHIDITTPKKL